MRARLRLDPRVALLGLLLWCTGAAAEVVPVDTAEDFVAALDYAASTAAPQTVIRLQQDVLLTPELVANYTTPFEIASNHSIIVEGTADGPQLTKLDLGQIIKLLYFHDGSRLTMHNLNISGMADPQLGSWPANVDSPTVAQTMPFWPTVISDPGYTSVTSDSYVTLHPTPLCDARIGAAQFAGLKQLAENAGSNATELYTNGTVGFFVDWGAPVPVLSAVTRVAVGTVDVWIRNTTLHCQEANSSSSGSSSGAPAPSPSSTDSSSSTADGGGSTADGGGTPAGVWAAVGVAAVLGVAAAAGALLWYRRRVRRLQRQALVLNPPSSDVEKASHSTKPGSEGMASNSLATPGNSIMLESVGTGSVPEGAWRSRVGFIDGLQLGGLIGRGGYARVYKGRWKGTMVAVKVVETHLSTDQRLDLRAEPLLSLSLSHPNVLQSYKMCAVRVITELAGDSSTALRSGDLSGGGGSPLNSGRSHSNTQLVPHLIVPNCIVEVMPSDAVLEPGMYEMWLVSELADKGTLADAMKAGRFTTAGDPPTRNIPMILLCMLDVARGLEYLHSCNIVHGDLKPQNVLLRTSGTDRRGFVCKLGDFGLSRMLPETETHVQTGSYGTVTYAAPELLKQGRLTKASDTFSMGVMLWELIAGERLFPDMHPTTVIIKVAQEGHRPPISPGFPAPMADLVQRCWAEDPLARPTAADIVRELISFSSTFSAAALQRREAAGGSNGASLRQLNLRPAEGAAPPPSFRQPGIPPGGA